MRTHAALLGAALGAWFAPTVAWPVVVLALTVLAAGRRRSLLVAGAVFLVASGAATHATRAMDFPEADTFDGWVTLVDDPRASGPVGVRVTVRSGRRRLVASAHGPAAGRLDDRLAGEQVRLRGTIRPVSRTDRRSLDRHVVGRITVEEVVDGRGAPPLLAGTNEIRRRLASGAESLSRADQALFLGMVIGDDRDQTAATADDFRAAGLGHLLVVSGQNVAFVLAIAMPVAGRLRPAGRAVVLFAVLGAFATLTRFEPSVLRAVAMAGVGIGSTALGRPVEGRRGLSLALAGLLLVDPFLIQVVAFQLSASATAGIVWLSAPLGDRLPGPGWLTVPVATTVSAQLAVAPVLVGIFGPMPLAALPANVLAGPASGVVMIWGCTGGLVAGVLGGTAARVLHLPTRALLWWIGGVARVSAAAPPAMLGAAALAVIGFAVLVAVVRRGWGAAAATVVALVCLQSVRSAAVPAPGITSLGDGVIVAHHDGSVVLLDDPGSPRRVLEQLRLAGVRRPVLIVARDGDRADADAVLALHDRFGPVPVAAPPLHRVPGGRTVQPEQAIVAGGLTVIVVEVEPRLEIAFGEADP
ncbi:MAG: ComEC/Rec2 family competence protein [Acidimicrobiales bacterium]|nr:ComEC/Rec2 family competence protein [Acidimicrobiales bacterium]